MNVGSNTEHPHHHTHHSPTYHHLVTLLTLHTPLLPLTTLSQLALLPCYWKRCVLRTYFLAEAWCPGPFLYISLLCYNKIFSSLKCTALKFLITSLKHCKHLLLILLIMSRWEERVCAWECRCLLGPEEGTGSLQQRLHAVLSYSNKWWELNSDPLQEQYVLLTVEWSLHPHWEALFSASFPDHSFILSYNIILYYSSPTLPCILLSSILVLKTLTKLYYLCSAFSLFFNWSSCFSYSNFYRLMTLKLPLSCTVTSQCAWGISWSTLSIA